MGLLKTGYVVLRYAFRIVGVLRLRAGVACSRIPAWIEGRTWSSAGMARRDIAGLGRPNRLAGLAQRSRCGVDIGGQSQARCHEQIRAQHYRCNGLFHEFHSQVRRPKRHVTRQSTLRSLGGDIHGFRPALT